MGRHGGVCRLGEGGRHEVGEHEVGEHEAAVQDRGEVCSGEGVSIRSLLALLEVLGLSRRGWTNGVEVWVDHSGNEAGEEGRAWCERMRKERRSGSHWRERQRHKSTEDVRRPRRRASEALASSRRGEAVRAVRLRAKALAGGRARRGRGGPARQGAHGQLDALIQVGRVRVRP